jgi:signal transduction histidine kinase
MTTIRTSAELIEMYLEGQKFETKKRIDKQLGTITGEIDRITELMNAVLTISKDDAGKTNFHPITFDLKKLCLDVIETSFDNQKDGRKVQTLFQGIEFNVFADRNLMEYSLFNLFNNAFKYSENSGDIILHITSNLTKINLEIIDFGIGIPKEDQHKLFNTFFRASNTNGIQGTGLGLYIVKTFTEKNFGKIRLESQLNKGTKVTLEFPLKKQ